MDLARKLKRKRKCTGLDHEHFIFIHDNFLYDVIVNIKINTLCFLDVHNYCDGCLCRGSVCTQDMVTVRII